MTRSIPGTAARSILCFLFFAALAGCGGSGSALGSGGSVGSGGIAGGGTGGTKSTGGLPSTGGFAGTGGNGGTVGTGSGNCTFVDGGTLPAVDQVTALKFSTATTISSNPAPPVYVTVTDAAKAQNAYQATLALPVFPPGTYACPIDWGVTYQLTFLLANGSNLTVTADPNGCSLVDIPGTCLRSVGSSDYWSELAQDLGIPESEIYPYSPNMQPVSQPDGGAAGACTTDSDCPAGLSCGYSVADGCVAKGVCVQRNFQEPVGPSEMCGCDGQGIVPVVVQGPSSSYTVLYASAPSSGKIGPCTGISVPDAATATTSDAVKQAQLLSPCSSDSDCGDPFLACVPQHVIVCRDPNSPADAGNDGLPADVPVCPTTAQVTMNVCWVRYHSPCQQDSDCGPDGFTCNGSTCSWEMVEACTGNSQCPQGWSCYDPCPCNGIAGAKNCYPPFSITSCGLCAADIVDGG